MTASSDIRFLIINSDTLEMQWVSTLLKMCFPKALQECHDTTEALQIEDISSDTIICCNDKLLGRIGEVLLEGHAYYPVLVLSSNAKKSPHYKNEGHFTLEIIPTDMLSPGLLKLAISGLRRDYKKEKQLKALAHFDPLTNTANRTLFNDRLKQAIKQTKRNASPLSILYFDLDKFKPVNDQYGHHTGDELLKLFTQKVRQNLRDIDTLGRLGGDEFAAILTNASLEQAENTAQRIIESLAIEENVDGHQLHVLTSIGILTCSTASKLKNLSLEQIMKEVDAATYQAKLEGKHSFVSKEL
jgi:diguanylate cyclase (GGDEF)-like protein